MSDIEFDENSLTAPETWRFKLPVGAPAQRLDKTLAGLIPQCSRNRLQAWTEEGHVQVNGSLARVRQIVYPGDEILVWPQPAPEALAFVPEPVDFEVVDSSPDWLVVFKPAGLVTHPGAGNWSGTLLNGLLYRFPEQAQVTRGGIVHRLDKDTSGLLVVARHEKAQADLVRQLKARTVGREYLALVYGGVRQAGKVDQPIGRDARVPVRMSVQHPLAPKQAVTHFQPLRVGQLADGTTLTEVVCKLETGRTHQIRVHMASLGHPLLADVLYGGRALAGVARQMLHARALAFDDPVSGARLLFSSPLPDDFVHALEMVVWE